MNYIKRFLYHTFTYTACITLVFFIFAQVFSLPDKTIGLGRFMLLLGFSSIIAISEFIFDIKSLKTPLKYTLHFAVLFLCFFILALNVRLEGGMSFSVPFLFTALFIFTLFYVLTVFVIYAVKSHLEKKK